MKGLVAGAAIIMTALLLGMCVQDWRTSTPQTLDAVIVGGSYSPGHYDTACSTDGNGQVTCIPSWVPPAWTLRYQDEAGEHVADVDERTYAAFGVRSKVYVRFFEGGGYFHARYAVRFFIERPPVEGS